MTRRILTLLTALALLIPTACAEGISPPPLWLADGPEIPEMPRFPAYTYEAGLLRIEEEPDSVSRVSAEYYSFDEYGNESLSVCELTFDEARGGWYSEEAAAERHRPDYIRLETDTLRMVCYNGGMADVTLLADGEPRFMWEYWVEPFEGLSLWDAPFIHVTIYPSADWPMETGYNGYGVLGYYIYTAADGARVRYESHDLIFIKLEKDGKQYAYAPSGGGYPAGWSVYTGDTEAHFSGYTPCETPDGVSEEDYPPLIDSQAWLAAQKEAYKNH
ncbi:MAG: hypothetical protein J1E43_11745 [Christensenellaceae bacterium]|nr:hypothetical protein [Christensenellaceae bacterium]